MHGSILARQAFGDCVFKYERKAGFFQGTGLFSVSLC